MKQYTYLIIVLFIVLLLSVGCGQTDTFHPICQNGQVYNSITKVCQ